MRIVIVGGVAGGMSAATRLRRLNEMAEIVVLEKGPYVSFANCGLPYYISREIPNREDLIVQRPEVLNTRYQLDIRVKSEVIKINKEDKTVVIQDENNTYDLAYDALILSPGAKAIIPNIKGIHEFNHIFSVRNIPDIDAIDNYIKNNEVKNALVVGGGFIGVEMAESLHNKGLKVSLVEMADQILPPLDKEMAVHAQDELIHQGINVITSKAASEFKEKTVVLDDGREINADLVILSIGVQPENKLAKDAGLELGIKGSIKVDANYQTSDPNIYAVGDAIAVKHSITNEDVLIALASPANRQGRQVADIISGIERSNKGSLGTSIVRVFNQAFASTGLNQKQLDALNYDYETVHVTSTHHVSYFPNAMPMTFKLLFNKDTGVIYGAQGFGYEGVDKRIDVLATSIKAKLTIDDLPELELSYAPPYGAAKDMINLLGYAALNIKENLSDSIQWSELDDELEKGAFLLDVRDGVSHNQGHIKGSHNIPLHFLRCRLHELPYDQTIITSCASGQLSYAAERILKQSGLKVKNLDGGLRIYGKMKPENLGKK
ncbi:FAD-dependent oxidoreductase [Erysipelothrix urinaevulpis]|uniref:FAD-dependent oxidoreductase n=1 Tax=Erysipelothrix urinaevulpis TaxID=2683717 RepID=UPI00135728FF|nr:FAD-dependent oxidoreductase [Erysipelothrix urinaevulpis]